MSSRNFGKEEKTAEELRDESGNGRDIALDPQPSPTSSLPGHNKDISS